VSEGQLKMTYSVPRTRYGINMELEELAVNVCV